MRYIRCPQMRLVPDIKGCDPMAAALLVECRGQDEAALQVGCGVWRCAVRVMPEVGVALQS